MANWIPKKVQDEIARYLREASRRAEAGFEAAQADEDSLTGAFGESLRTTEQHKVKVNQDEWTFKVTSKKFGGRGEGAQEKRIGANGIFEIEVESRSGKTKTKSLIFQAKKKGNNQKLKEQIDKMEEVAPKGAGVFVFGKDNYQACDASELINSDGDADAGRKLKAAKTLSQIGDYLSDRLLACKVGKIGMSYDANRKKLSIPSKSESVERVAYQLSYRLRIDVKQIN